MRVVSLRCTRPNTAANGTHLALSGVMSASSAVIDLGQNGRILSSAPMLASRRVTENLRLSNKKCYTSERKCNTLVCISHCGLLFAIILVIFSPSWNNRHDYVQSAGD
jgi:hypothetical protein